MLPPALEDLPNRRRAWMALSDLFLDTDPSLARPWRSQELASLPYSLAELERILVDEVYPVCRANLLGVAGEWAGFDPDWLEQRILKRLNSPLRVLHRLSLGRLAVHRSTEWRATMREVARLRGHSGVA